MPGVRCVRKYRRNMLHRAAQRQGTKERRTAIPFHATQYENFSHVHERISMAARVDTASHHLLLVTECCDRSR